LLDEDAIAKGACYRLFLIYYIFIYTLIYICNVFDFSWLVDMFAQTEVRVSVDLDNAISCRFWLCTSCGMWHVKLIAKPYDNSDIGKGIGVGVGVGGGVGSPCH